MSKNNCDKVLYIEKRAHYPYVYTNSKTVCNLMNDTSMFPVGDPFDILVPNITNIADPDYAYHESLSFEEVMDSGLRNILEVVGCKIIMVDVQLGLLLDNYIMLEHKVCVE